MDNSMDFFADSIFPEFDRSEFIGGIDNEALDFGALDQYMSATATVANIDVICNNNNNNNNNNENNNNEQNCGSTNAACDAKIESPASSPTVANDTTKHMPISSISAHVIRTIVNGQMHAHLPESPPDSGSEPPYSPLQDVHGLTLTSRDLYAGLTTELPHINNQYTPPHHAQHHAQQQQHYTNLLPQQQQQQQHNAEALNQNNEIRVKHETGLIMTTSHQPATNDNRLNINDTQQMDTFQMPCNAMNHYDNLNNTLYTPVSYANVLVEPDESTRTCMLTTSSSDGTCVQIVGTSQANANVRTSAPSTPVNSNSRKRKLSTQIDCGDSSMLINNSISPTTSNMNMSCKITPENAISPALSSINIDNSLDGGSSNAANSTCGDNADGNSNVLSPCIRFCAFQPQNWHKLVDHNLQELNPIYYRVDADKGFNFSTSDDAFVCQKKNHFQITCHARLQGDAKFVKTGAGLEKIKSFHLHFYGVKLETPNQTIRVEQSQSDRSKKPFFPVPIDLQSHIVSKITVGRLHFSETTNNNMRKKGRPNPEQRYFQLVVGLHVHTVTGNFPVASQGSERIIVRASNPGQFESDVDLCWQRGVTQDSICHAGRVGINTDRPDESLVVHGNLKVSGHIVQPSDSRAKHEIGELDTSVQLRNLLKIRIVKYRYERDFAIHSGLTRANDSDSEEIVDTGVIAQEVREVIPDAVQEAGSIVLPNGNVIENFLLVNKDRILMENIGAVKELSKVTGCLETRIEHLERMNDHLVSAKKNAACNRKMNPLALNRSVGEAVDERCSNRFLQLIIFLLVIVMAACLTAVSTLYFMEHNKQIQNYKNLENMQDAEHLLQLHSILSRNKTYTHWPNLTYFHSTMRAPYLRNKTQAQLNDAFTYNENNDGELTAIMEKPLYQSLKEQSYKISTSAPAHNKTLHNSKTKSKWPLPQEILRIAAAVQQQQQQSSVQVTTANSIGSKFTTAAHAFELEEALNVSKTASDKVAADSIPLPQDFENNSIDVDAQQHVTKKPLISKTSAPAVAVVAAAQSLNDAVAAHESSLEQSDADVAPKLSKLLNEENEAATSSTVSSINLKALDETTATAPTHSHRLNSGDVVIYSVYKAVSPPTSTLALTTNKLVPDAVQTNSSIEAATAANKSNSAVDNADALDLQNLSSNNDSVDNPITALFGFEYKNARESNLGRRSATQQQTANTVPVRIIQLEEIGAPQQCLLAGAHCTSACYEEPKELSLSSPEATDKQLQQDVDSEAADSEDEDAHEEAAFVTNSSTSIISGKSSHNTDALAKQLSVEQKQIDEDVEKHLEQSDEHFTEEDVTEAVHDDTSCFWITGHIVSSELNKRLGKQEQYCPKNGKSLILTYIIPVSQYSHQSSLQLHLSSTQALQWTVCSEREYLQPIAKRLTTQKLLPRSDNTSIFQVNLPARGAFTYNLQLRSAISLLPNEDICNDQAHKINTLLQYNFSILRNCD